MFNRHALADKADAILFEKAEPRLAALFAEHGASHPRELPPAVASEIFQRAVIYETIRSWVLKFGPVIARRRLRQRRPRPSDRWHLDEMVVRIADERMYPCGVPSTMKARPSTCWFRVGAIPGLP
jgi:hypothetical protein